MNTKLFEVRDSATFIPVMATKLQPDNSNLFERYLLRRAGFTASDNSFVALMRLTNGEGHYASEGWGASTRTMRVAHQYIEEHFDALTSGDVVDVEYILGLSNAPKVSERYETQELS